MSTDEQAAARKLSEVTGEPIAKFTPDDVELPAFGDLELVPEEEW